MRRLFLQYMMLRGRQYLHDSLGLYRRFFFVFFIAYSIALGNDTPAVNAAIAGLLSNRPWESADFAVLIFFQIYALAAVVVTKKSLVGGRVQYLAQSLPLPIAWERAVRAFNLSLMNTVILLFCGFGLSILSRNPPMLVPGLILALSFYLSFLNLQLQLAESRWWSLGLGVVTGYSILLSRGTLGIYPLLIMNLALTYWVLHRKPLGPQSPQAFLKARSFQLRSKFLKFMPSPWIFQISYCIRKPALLLYALLGAAVASGVLYMVMMQAIGLGQKIYVYTVINGFLSLLPAAYFASFNKIRDEHRIFLNSLPQSAKTWLERDQIFVIALFLIVTLPTAAVLVARGYIPLILPMMSLPLLSLRYLAFHRSTDSKEKAGTEISILYGSLLWFGVVGFMADFLLNR